MRYNIYSGYKEITSDGTLYYDKNNKYHRIDGPAIEYIGGRYKGHKVWYIHGSCHRENGPAIEWYTGDKYWYLNDKKHREDGPAVEHICGGQEYWFNGIRYIFEEWQQIVKWKAFL